MAKARRRRRRTKQSRTADPIDLYVASRLREARLRARLTQAEIGNAMGITFQAVQKFEVGRMRLAASRLHVAAKVLGHPVAYFFAGIDQPAAASNALPDLTTGDLELIAAFRCIKDTRLREEFRRFIAALTTWYVSAEPESCLPRPLRDRLS